jgi:hypothetical protein
MMMQACIITHKVARVIAGQQSKALTIGTGKVYMQLIREA